MKNPQQLRDWCNRDGSKSSEQARKELDALSSNDRKNKPKLTYANKVFLIVSFVYIIDCSIGHFW